MTEFAEAHLNGFLDTLAGAGFEMHALRRMDFLRALTIVEMVAVDDLYWAARITLVSHVDQLPVFDSVFAEWFRGRPAVLEAAQETEEGDAAVRPQESDVGSSALDEAEAATGKAASLDDLVNLPGLAPACDEKREICREISRVASRSLPTRLSRRAKASPRRGTLDLRRTLALIRRYGGDAAMLAYRERPLRQRRVLLFVDVSGSQKETSPDALRAAYAMAAALRDIEVFTFGTRLTRITGSLRSPDMDAALAGLADVIFDFEGGTRIGTSFKAFLDDPRLLTFARGAVVIVISDGLETGDATDMAAATERLARLSHRLVWLTPLMGDPHYRPATRGMRLILSSLDRVGDASSLHSILEELENFDVRVESPPRRSAWRAWQVGANIGTGRGTQTASEAPQ